MKVSVEKSLDRLVDMSGMSLTNAGEPNPSIHRQVVLGCIRKLHLSTSWRWSQRSKQAVFLLPPACRFPLWEPVPSSPNDASWCGSVSWISPVLRMSCHSNRKEARMIAFSLVLVNLQCLIFPSAGMEAPWKMIELVLTRCITVQGEIVPNLDLSWDALWARDKKKSC